MTNQVLIITIGQQNSYYIPNARYGCYLLAIDCPLELYKCIQATYRASNTLNDARRQRLRHERAQSNINHPSQHEQWAVPFADLAEQT